MNQLVPFKYVQPDQPCVARDVREKRLMEVVRKHCFFIGFRITIDYVMRYRHALILADSYESLICGIHDECDDVIEKGLATSRSAIELVFVRNLQIKDLANVAPDEAQDIASEIQEALTTRDDYRFTVLGILGDEQICLIHEHTRDGLRAMRLARWESNRFTVKNFIPLDVRQAHPATREFEVQFHLVADWFVKLVESPCGMGQLQ